MQQIMVAKGILPVSFPPLWVSGDLRVVFGRAADEAMSQPGSACQPPPDVDTDDCLHEYCYLFSPDLLAGKVAFVTGGGSGIGFRIAEILMRHGCQTVIASRNIQRVTEAAKKLSAATGQRCLPLTLDVRQPQAIMAAVDEALREFKRIDILVNNAAGNFLCPASALSFNGYKTVMEIDTLGTFNVSKVLYEKCLRDHGGVIVNITATLSYRGQALQVHAGTAKAAIDAMTKHLAVEWGPNRIRVNSVAPGPITGTEGVRRLAPKEAERSIYQKIPLQRAGNKTEIAHSVLYLASPLASYVTGTTLVVDGGAWMTTENNFPALLGIASHSAKL
ncbi:peroxisomal 2,4-dienoyl-CoA reductase [(3E)-enoyl-CoA-producing] isoform X2 [Pogona vitticeps]|uniref:Peroxisomal 2,4-dienoyl-CoA reductase [(3E)-enoyl-CoA-producing] n=1 Tax=Pogona vitticeps TaxID=103695 RepID=A0ABM5EZX8_9SAUR